MHAGNVCRDDPLCPWASRWELQFPKARGCGNSTHTFQDCFPSAFPRHCFRAECTALESLALSAHGAWVGTIKLYAHLPNVGLFFTLWTSLDGVMPPSCPQPWPQCEPAFGLSSLLSGVVCPLKTLTLCSRLTSASHTTGGSSHFS